MSDHDSAAADLPAPPPEPARSKRVALIIVLVVAVLIAGFFFILVRADNQQSDTADSPLIGRVAPAITAHTLDGTPFDLQRRKGSWVVLNFFNSTCVPCKTEHPELVKFAEEQKALSVNGAELYTVVWGNDRDGDVRKFFADNGGDWPVLVDPEGNLAVVFAVPKVPETWIIDPNGIVQWRIISNTTADFITARIAEATA